MTWKNKVALSSNYDGVAVLSFLKNLRTRKTKSQRILANTRVGSMLLKAFSKKAYIKSVLTLSSEGTLANQEEIVATCQHIKHPHER